MIQSQFLTSIMQVEMQHAACFVNAVTRLQLMPIQDQRIANFSFISRIDQKLHAVGIGLFGFVHQLVDVCRAQTQPQQRHEQCKKRKTDDI